MRISERDAEFIVITVRKYDKDSRIVLFGSRTDDSLKGGDIDLLLESDKIKLAETFHIGYAIEQQTMIPTDIIVQNPHDTYSFIAKIANETGVRLG